MFRIIHPDPARRVDLPGIGPVPRPLEVGTDVSGLRHVRMRGYTFVTGHIIEGQSEEDEVFIFLHAGRIHVEVSPGATSVGAEAEFVWRNLYRPQGVPSAPQGIYMPPNYSYRLTVLDDATVLYARGGARGSFIPQRLQWRRSRFSNAGHAWDLLVGKAETLACRVLEVLPGNTMNADTGSEAIGYVDCGDAADSTGGVFSLGQADHRNTQAIRTGDALVIPPDQQPQTMAPAGATMQIVLFTGHELDSQ